MEISGSKARCHIKVVPLCIQTHLSIHMFGPHTCNGCLRGLATCVIIGELGHLRGPMDGHHFDQQQQRGCTTKVDYSWSILRSILVRCLSGLPTESGCVCVGGGLLLHTLLGEPWLGACIHILGLPSCRHEGGGLLATSHFAR